MYINYQPVSFLSTCLASYDHDSFYTNLSDEIICKTCSRQLLNYWYCSLVFIKFLDKVLINRAVSIKTLINLLTNYLIIIFVAMVSPSIHPNWKNLKGKGFSKRHNHVYVVV